MVKNKLIQFFLAFSLATLPTMVLAYDDDEGLGYDQIVSELSQSRASISKPTSTDPFENVMIHGGLGFVTSYLTLSPSSGKDQNIFLKGVEAYFGIDLFSPYWMAEGGMRSYSNEKLDDGGYASLKEFDLKVIYKPELNRFLILRTGLGLSARYLDYADQNDIVQEFTTPSMVLVLGFEAKISQTLSLGTELAYHSAMIEDTIDHSAIDGSFRINLHF